MSFQKEFEQRLRRVCGVEDDSCEVTFSEAFNAPSFEGCDTCGYGADEGRAYIEVTVKVPHRRVYREFSDMGELLRLMDKVDLTG